MASQYSIVLLVIEPATGKRFNSKLTQQQMNHTCHVLQVVCSICVNILSDALSYKCKLIQMREEQHCRNVRDRKINLFYDTQTL